MKKTLKKGLAYLLAVSMIITYMPATTFALEGVQADPGSVSLEANVDGITVTAEAEASVLPENAALDVSVLKDEDLAAYTDKVEAGLKDKVLDGPVAIEVKFVDKNDENKTAIELADEAEVLLTISDSSFEGKEESLKGFFIENKDAEYEAMDPTFMDNSVQVKWIKSGVYMFSETKTKEAETTSDQSTEDADGDGEESHQPVKLGVANAPEVSSEDAVGDTRATDTTWTVTFYDEDAQVHATVEVEKEQAIGNKMPAVINKVNNDAYWAIGEIVDGTISVTGERIDNTFVPNADTVVVPDYDPIYKVHFYKDVNKTEEEADSPKEVHSSTSYCLNDIPTVPHKDKYIGKWVYEGGDFSNSVVLTKDTDVWPEYQKNFYTVTFNYGVEGYEDPYETIELNPGETLTLPDEPVVAGKDFVKWVDEGGNEYTEGSEVTSDLTLTAQYTNQLSVQFIVRDKMTGVVTEMLTQYFSEGARIGTMPEDPFVEGRVFEKWVKEENGKPTDIEITAQTVVSDNIIAVAKFRDITIYNITAEYYYESTLNQGKEVVFNRELLQVEGREFSPYYTITPPATTQTSGDEVSGAPIYYPEKASVQLSLNDFDDNNSITVRVKYVPYTAEYEYVYMLKNLDDENYTEIENSREHVFGVLNSYVSPTVKAFDYAVFDRAEDGIIKQVEGQELKVYYNRKNYQLTYETNGGSYVGGGTYPYQTEVSVSSTTPTKDGYTFAGWYKDADLTQPAGNSVTMEGDTTLYAKWNGATVHYTIVYLFEKYNDAGTESSYVYDNSRDATGTVGSTVQASSAPTVTRTGWERDTAKNSTSSVKIAADGSSVLYVYYKLREYTFYFNAGSYNYSSVTATLTGKNVSGTGTLNYTMKVKLGQDISSAWPANVTGQYTTGGWWSETHDVDFNGWRPAGSNTRYVTKRTIVTEDMLPNTGNSITYTAQWTSNANTYTVNYWLQNADDDQYTRSEVYSQTYTSSSGHLTAKDIDGYTYDHGNSGQSGVTTYNFYYNRDTYKIDYYHGSDLLDTIQNVKFDANINKSPYKWTPTAAQCGVDEDYTFVGWYADSGLTTPYTFTTMPSSNLLLYAKWKAPDYTVSFLDVDGTTEVAASQTVEKYHKAEKPANPTKAGYTFEGWYTSVGGNDRFDWNTQITKDTKVYAHWTRNTLKYTVQYVDGDGNPVANEKKVANPNNEAGQSITEYAVAVAGYRPDANSKQLTLTTDDSANVIRFVYTIKSGTTSYKVRYILNPDEYPGDIEVHAEKPVNDVPADTASVIELAKAVDYNSLYAAHPELNGLKFFPDQGEKTLVLTSNQQENVLTFIYSKYKSVKVTVHFADMAGNPIPEVNDDVQNLKVGNTFTLSHTSIPGWEFNKAVVGKDYDGTSAQKEYPITEAEATGLEFTLFYQKKATVTAVSHSKQYDGTVLTVGENLEDQVTVEELVSGDSLKSIGFAYTKADSNNPEGRLNAGVATVTPKDAKINSTSGHTDNYYKFHYVSGTLEVKKINVTVRIEPDRWTGNIYDGTEKKTGFTNGSKTLEKYVLISHDGYKDKYLNTIWDTIKSLKNVTPDSSASGLGYYVEAQTDVGYYPYTLGFTEAMLPQDANYSVTLFVRDGLLEIKPKDITVTTESANKPYDGAPLTNAKATVTGIVEGETYKIEATGSQTGVGESFNDYSITWAAEGNEYTAKDKNYTIAEENLGTLKVTNAPLSITIKDKTTTYNGSEQKGYDAPATVTGTGSKIENDKYVIEGLAKDQVLTISGYTPAKGTDVNIYENGSFDGATITVKASAEENAEYVTDYYTITTTAGKLKIEPKAVTIQAKDASKTYDGNALTEDGFKASALEAGDTHTFTVVMTEASTITDYKEGGQPNVIATVDGTAVTTGSEVQIGNYLVTTVDGKLTINKKEVTLKSESAEKAYDGEALTRPEVKGQNGFLDKDIDKSVEIKATGSVLNAGETAVNEIVYKLIEAAKNNYDVKLEPGTLKIIANTDEVVVTITENGDKVTYDGKSHTLKGYTAQASSTLYDVTKDFTFNGNDTVTETNAGKYQMQLKPEDFQNTNTNFSNVRFVIVDGELEIEPKAVTIKAEDASKTYDGNPLTQSAFKASALEEGDTHTFAVEMTEDSTITDYKEGGQPNVIATVDGTAVTTGSEVQIGNYLVTTVDGKLTISKAPLTITAKPRTYTYNGSDQGPAGTYTEGFDTYVTVEGLVGGDALSSITLAGKKTDAGTYTEEIVPSAANVAFNHETTKTITDNYEVTYKAADLTIDKAGIMVMVNGSNDSKVYNGADQTSETTVTPSCEDDLFDATKFSYSGATTITKANAGNYSEAIDITKAAYDDANLAVTFTAGTPVSFKIEPKAVTVTPNNLTITEGDPEPTLTATVDGLVGTDTIEYTLNRASGTEPGTYTITASGEKAQGNYEVTYGTGTLTIREKSTPPSPGPDIPDDPVPLDLTTDHYAYVEGYEDGTVKPEGKITRAETATMIYRLLTVDRRDEVFTDQNNYSDVNKPDWYNKAVSSMTKGEYINGYPDGTFKANNSITRAEFVTILVRFLDGPRDGDLPFSDVKGHWAEQYITTAVQAGWIDGYPDGTFQPDKEISRAEAVKIINTVLHRGVNEHSELGDYINFPDNNDASKWYYYELIEAVNDHEAENERPDENWISNKCEFEYDIDKYERP